MYKLLILFILVYTFSFSQTPGKLIDHNFRRCNKVSDNRYVIIQNNKWGVIDSSGTEVIPLRYARLDYQNGLLIADSGSGQGLITLNNEVITPLEFRWVLPRDNSRFVVHKESKWGLIDDNNNIIIPNCYTII